MTIIISMIVGLSSCSKKYISEHRSVSFNQIINAYEHKDSSLIDMTDALAKESLKKNDYDNYYRARLLQTLFETRYGDRSKSRLALFNIRQELDKKPNNVGEAYYHFVLGHFYYYRTQYNLAIDDLDKSLELCKSISSKDSYISSMALITKARAEYGIFKCEEALTDCKNARTYGLSEYWESVCNQIESLCYAYLEDKENFFISYDAFTKNNISTHPVDSLLLAGYNDFFVDGIVDFDAYKDIMEPIKWEKFVYLISKIKGDYKTAHDYYQKYQDRSKRASAKETSEDYNQASFRIVTEHVGSQYQKYITNCAIALAVLVLIGACLIIAYIRKKNLEVIKANQEKTDFVQTMAHDVRTPLNAVVGFSQLLSLPAEYLSDEERSSYSQFVTNNAQLLTILIDDVLNVKKGSSNMSIVIGPCNANAIGKQAVMTCQHRCAEDVEMKYDSNVDDEFIFNSDPNRVLQVIINLLSNSTKNTSKGSITLTASLTANPGWLTYFVTDTGIGIPEDKQDVIFERFVKIDKNKQGSGLGLNICTQIAEKLGAKIGLDKSYKEGARFFFMLPIK